MDSGNLEDEKETFSDEESDSILERALTWAAEWVAGKHGMLGQTATQGISEHQRILDETAKKLEEDDKVVK